MYPPNDRAVCAYVKILMDFHSGNTMHLRYPATSRSQARPEWARTPAQEVARAISAQLGR